ncbi:MAG: TetR family transcriptional regulator [Gemmatimonadetes bacterium]|nr:TetR/AcrR family transcriptional regulator [Gemmatimonadota bacterium]NIR77324.1 TetR/AcrR family transcriptional regulator [Gemmatimonadota bacterium]NIT85850.1 TetR/AcrR family transcriptional regulator [Gemmatimonadota bacterium]NIU29672.1 TetR/AcrR family transcriptional regulator [Gemmatimonadota bacterium]NIU34716.1 TetR family transcriptional regulator [Gemmatimonadota bacterium]
MAPDPHAASTRDRLVHAARELFWRKGYNSTSVAEILRAADANSGSLYHYFPTKQALLVAVLDWYADNLGPEIVEPAAEAASDPIGRVFAILDGYRRALLATDLTFGCPIGNVALELLEPDPEVREKLALNFDQWCGAVEACLGEAGERLPDDLDRRALSRFVLTTMEGGVMQARTHRSIEPFDASVRMLRDYVRRLEEEARSPVS